MKNWVRYLLIGVIVIISVAVISIGSIGYYSINFRSEDYNNFNEEEWENPLNNEGIFDNKELYNLEEELKVNQFYITILDNQKGNKTFEEINKANNLYGETDEKLDIFFETSEDKSILNNGLYIKEANGILEVRGKDSQKAVQKSYKINLSDKKGTWNGQSVININKNPFDSVRIRNKLAYDLIAKLDDITSFRTEFVRVFIRDLSSEDKDSSEFVDYGFFTHIEQPNKIYLKNHGLDPNGQLYKAENFNFSRYSDVIMQSDNPNYSKKVFEEILEINGDKNHTDLIAMLDAVNNEDIDINETIGKYFDMDNYLTWLAVNILFDNYQSSSENLFLYSPLNSQKFYFIPWDFDEAFGNLKERPKWKIGASLYWDNVIHRRFLSKDENIKLLTEKVEEISNILNKEEIRQVLNKYYDIVMANVTKLPDFKYLNVELSKLREEYNGLSNIIEENKSYYYKSLKDPMPFKIIETTITGDSVNIKWTTSYSLEGRDITYDVYISKDINFNTVEHKVEGIKNNSIKIDNIASGDHYLKVIAKDSYGNTQISYSIYKENDDKFFGIDKLVR